MTTTETAVEFVRYQGSPMRDLIAFGDNVRLANRGVIFAVSPDIRYRILHYLNGTDSEKAYFQPVEAEYVSTLRHCQPCQVWFEGDETVNAHLRLHDKAKQTAQELGELRHLEAQEVKQQAAIATARETLKDIRQRKQALELEIAAKGYEAHIVTPGSDPVDLATSDLEGPEDAA